MKPHRFVPILALSGFTTLAGHAAVHTFTGSDGDWNNAASWNANGIAPTTGNHLLRLNVNGTANFNHGTTITFTGTPSPSAEDRGLVIGAGSDAANSYTLTISSGTVIVTNPSGSLIGAGNGNSFNGQASLVLSGGNLQANGEVGVLARGMSTASGTLTINSGSTLTADIVSFGTLASTTGAATVNVNTGGTLKARAILDRFTAANSTLNIDGGTIVANDTNHDEKWLRDDNGGMTVKLLAGGATFDTNGQRNQRIAVPLSGAGALTKAGEGELVLATDNTYLGTTQVLAGTLQLGDNGTIGSIGAGALTLAEGTTLAISRSDNQSQSTFTGAGASLPSGLSGNVAFSKRGNGILWMDVANSHTGATTITGGALKITDASFLPASSPIAASATGSLALAGLTLNRDLTLGGTGMTITHAGTEFLAVQRGALQGASGTSTLNGNITLSEAFTRIGVQDGATLVINGDISGTSTQALILRGGTTNPGLVEIHGTASGYGDTHIYGRTIRLGTVDALPEQAILTVGTINVGTSILDLNGLSPAINGLRSESNSPSGVITNDGIADSLLTIHNTIADRSYFGVIQDGITHKVAVVTDGPFRQTFAGNNTYSGSTTVNGGTLSIIGDLPNSPVTVSAAGTLRGTGNLGAPLTVAGTVAPGLSAGTLLLADTSLTGTYACEIDGTENDVLDVDGDLNLTGASLAVSMLDGGFPESEYVIAVYTGELTGTFATVTPGYEVDYDTPGQIKLTSTANPYDTWAATTGVTAGTPDTDSDGDGIPNGIEFVIGGTPAPGAGSDSSALLPTFTTDATHLIFTFRRSVASVSFAPYVQYGSTLSGWTPAVHNAPEETPVIVSTESNVAPGIDRITVRIPRALASGNRFFARLAVDIP
ncbi:autotransporter-associated beta strand repeat-containing protein [Luteolibacter arcticus]|uniref:Autotransporter-associated beta strand repeat-containing protein n=1 Tax=Luteolibacter arcticus TaxID=1581411 RepID=A0ABT3GP90_9BACT|nr:autotransporter-associated beta strand repeat-containing protein [Luteolibacter arcticus]MCW1925295.1 autotransporter-associated beta strand repeat-containing protein [Luteolibacter arcticus]